ncbi:Protein FAR1-RELATED SEQUENCE like [Actinidia chinensis var. chinensis]|uniref:Protein FAR1-RELATED SEQUENCE like n=1 Tax=Actinidia chinensis var. chinensis TaxID=1590841 RepID=A0A2R6QFX8_ACTCC|nr:Protein FAR1-RELATED SEQUENCE like [Actinidia chinensis var. chinensis]
MMSSCLSVTQIRTNGPMITYMVKEREEDGDLRGIRKFEALCVLNYNGVEEIPSQYVLSQWRKDFKLMDVPDLGSKSIDIANPVWRLSQLSFNMDLIEGNYPALCFSNPLERWKVSSNIWMLWRSRNDLVYSGKLTCPDWHLETPPTHGLFRIKFDDGMETGGTNGCDVGVAKAVLLQPEQLVHVNGISDLLAMKVIAALEGLKLTVDLGIQDVELEGDPQILKESSVCTNVDRGGSN